VIKRKFRRDRVGFYTRREERLNSLTHGLGLVLSFAGFAWLLVTVAGEGNPRLLFSLIVYGVSLQLLYLASTLYHSVHHKRTKRWLRILDHSAIYIFIAGSYTPFLLLTQQGALGWRLLVPIWSLALAGVLYKSLFIHRYENLSTALYVAMGWMGILVFRDILASVPVGAIWWLFAGGLFYTTGVLFFAFPRIRYSHAIWHLFVLGGSSCHYAAIAFHLVPAASV
jgi:hemolysin III